MLFLVLAFSLPGLGVGAVLSLPSVRQNWRSSSARSKVGTVVLAISSFMSISGIIHLVAGLTSKCAMPDCAMGYMLVAVLFLPAGLILLCSGLLLRAKLVYAITGHMLLAPVVADFVLWAMKSGYESVIPWGG